METELTADLFKPLEGQTFRIHVQEGEPVNAELIEVRGLQGDTVRADKSPFSLLFRGPADAPLQQSIFAIEHGDLGELHLFLVTVGPDPDHDGRGMLYEAVFT